MWPNLQETKDLDTFTEKILKKSFFFCAVNMDKFYGTLAWVYPGLLQTSKMESFSAIVSG